MYGTKQLLFNEQLDSLVQTVHTSSKGIGIEFNKNKCKILVLKKTKVFNSGGTQLHDTQITKYIEDSGYKYIRVLEAERFKGEQ